MKFNKIYNILALKKYQRNFRSIFDNLTIFRNFSKFLEKEIKIYKITNLLSQFSKLLYL